VKLSVVATLYHSAPYLAEFVARTSASARRLVGDDFELVLVNDGSPDGSADLALELREQFPEIVLVDLARNTGHHRAAMTGLAHTRGALVFLIDSDLEEEPELLERFWPVLAQEECDVVYGVTETRKGDWFERVSGEIFYRALDFLTDLRFPRNMLMARLMTRQYVKSLLMHSERELFLGGLLHLTGYRQVGLPVHKHSKGTTTYHLRRKISVAITSVVSLSDKPLRMIFYTGAFMSLASAIGIVFLIARRLIYSTTMQGWASVVVSIWFMGGLLIFCIGVIGIYLSNVFIETKRRPYAIIRAVHGPERQTIGQLFP
jgi:putative glycosyltransferase